MKYSCGCVNEIDETSGVLHCVEKCDFHVEWSKTHEQGGTAEYYKEIGLLEDGVSNNKRLIDELLEPLTELTTGEKWYLSDNVLELGCGLGPYIPYFLRSGWYYEAVERSPFAVNWVRKTFDVPVHEVSFEEFMSTRRWDLILAEIHGQERLQ